jgi:hypothetical protein
MGGTTILFLKLVFLMRKGENKEDILLETTFKELNQIIFSDGL